ncbi:MAG TPA: transketolase, partial [Clostridia bacterium]|nr:transketolase [Clostridia bacterium]
HTPGVETTTGPLGQGIANAVGMALAESFLAAKFNKPGYNIVDHYTYVLTGDGCMMEGIEYEAASLAGTLKLGKLIVIYDSNKITIEGSTDIAFTEDVGKRHEAQGWHVVYVENGNDIDAVSKAVDEAKSVADKPSLIIAKTQIGYGCPKKQGTASAHGEPLGEECIAETRKNLGYDYEPFEIPSAVKEHIKAITAQGAQAQKKWEEMLKRYSKEYPELYNEYVSWHSLVLPDLLNNPDLWRFEGKMATRAASGEAINRLCKLVPNMIGGAADLAPSTKTEMKGRGDFSAANRTGANLRFGIREHAMAAITNGIALHGGLRPYCSTFFVFSDYMKNAMRMTAIMDLPVIYVLTHDSIGVGEDGPTHEPVEHLAGIRAIPNMTVFRPADAKETMAGYVAALTSKKPFSIILTRQNLPLYQETDTRAMKGAYILKDAQNPDIILMASGSEVEFIYKASEELAQKGIKARVISFPSWELFEQQSEEYKEALLPKSIRARVAVEAGVTQGWHKYVGLDGAVIGIDRFGASAPANILFREFGFTVENVVNKALEVLGKKENAGQLN